MIKINKLVSIIVPIYKVEKYLDECIKSISNQTYKDIEIVLVDDGSPDKCPHICDMWREKDSRIVVIHKKNGGVSDARNCGLENASGSYIMFVDPDDWIDPSMVAKMVEAIEKYKTEIVSCRFYYVGENYKRENFIMDEDFIVYDNKLQNIQELYIENGLSNHLWRYIYLRELFDDILFPIGRTYEDISTLYKVFLRSSSIVLIKDILYYYRQNDEGIMATKSKNNVVSLYKAYLERDRYVDGLALQENFIPTTYRIINYIYVWNMINYCDEYDYEVKSIKNKAETYLKKNLFIKKRLSLKMLLRYYLIVYIPDIYSAFLRKNRNDK